MKAIENFFSDYAAALMSYSPEKISSFYQTPLTVFSDQGSQTVDDMADVVAFWKEGVKPYAAQKISLSKPEVLNAEQLSKTIWISKVLWTNTDTSGKIVANETNFYILSGTGMDVKIIGLIIMAK
jgi:hypothetical protein